MVTREERLLRIARDVAEAMDDEHGFRPSLRALQLSYGVRIGKAIDELIEVQREEANAAIPGFTFNPVTNEYERAGVPLTQDEVEAADLPDPRFIPYGLAETQAVEKEVARLTKMGIDEESALTIVADPRFRGEYVRPLPKLIHTIGGRMIGPDNPGAYGRTHDMNCPACVASGTPYTASPRSETYWSS